MCQFCDSSSAVPLETAPWKNRPDSSHANGKEWRGELNQRLQAYRARRSKSSGYEGQSALPFEQESSYPPRLALGVQEQTGDTQISSAEDFAFTVAIGRLAKDQDAGDARLLIDVSVPPNVEEPEAKNESTSLLPASQEPFLVASLEQRRRALLVDVACLVFAYGGFLALFGSLGGQFTLSKMSAAICFFTFAFVYIQYFGLFTIFGGTTPGMMLCGLQVASFTSDAPSPRQYLLRAAGYLLSAGTCFLGFLWVLWDEDGLTWHDRLSQTYLAPIEAFGEEEMTHPVAPTS